MGIVEGAALAAMVLFVAGLVRLFVADGFTARALVIGGCFAASLAALSFAALVSQFPQ